MGLLFGDYVLLNHGHAEISQDQVMVSNYESDNQRHVDHLLSDEFMDAPFTLQGDSSVRVRPHFDLYQRLAVVCWQHYKRNKDCCCQVAVVVAGVEDKK